MRWAIGDWARIRLGDLHDRRQAYARASTALACLDDDQLRAALLASSSEGRAGWGASAMAEVAGTAVFVKRVPLTDLERAHMSSTRNRFRLPSYYSYGVGSAGFGVFRELALHVKTTNWVLQGACESFPLLFHHRVMRRDSQHSGDRPLDVDDYVRRWNSSKAVANYIRARAEASHEVCLVLERFPYTLATWLPGHQAAAGRVVGQLCETVAFLRSHGIVHFDVQPWNFVGDEDQLYLTDFGLALDPQFDLTERERAFLARHSHYDYGEALAGMGAVVLEMLRTLPPDDREQVMHKYGLTPAAGQHRMLATVLERLDQLRTDGDLLLHPALVECLTSYGEVIVFMSTFLTELQRNPRKNTPYDDEALAGLLASAGILS